MLQILAFITQAITSTDHLNGITTIHLSVCLHKTVD